MWVSLGCQVVMGNKRLIIDFLGHIRFSQLPYTACSVAVCSLLVATCGLFGCVGICIRSRGGTPVKMPYFRYTRRIHGNMVIVPLGPLLGLTLLTENFLHYHYVAVLALHSHTHVFVLALVIYQHNLNRMPIAVY